MTLLLEPWPELYREARDREGEGWINLLQAAAARIELARSDQRRSSGFWTGIGLPSTMRHAGGGPAAPLCR